KEEASFIALLSERLEKCEWSEDSIGAAIREVATECGLGNRQAYVSLYLVILGRDYGPRISSIMAEMDRSSLTEMLSRV
ncbi:MAG: hypothetical protein CMA68_00295, partial [Euryarchaeota archaeon]|nr:hypothetical protein [Euryarchaeota archaeon]